MPSEKLAMLRMSEGERKSYEKYLINLVSERDAYKTSRKKGWEEGVEIGKEEGREEGREEGETMGMIHAILTVLKLLGPIPAELEQRIRDQKDRAVLTEWLNHAVRAKGVEEFMTVLGG